MYDSAFQSLIDQKHPTGEVVAVDQFIVTMQGLAPIGMDAMILFENGVQGVVSDINGIEVTVLNMDAADVSVGMLGVLQSDILEAKVGKELVGRVISARGKPLDGKSAPATTASWPVFRAAPSLMERQILDQQLESGVTLVDTLFPIVLGQRIAVIGDSKTGKTNFLLQLAGNQAKKDRIVIYVMISKNPNEIADTIARLQADGSLEHTIVIATSVFDSLVESYLAPYVACAIGEYLWYGGTDVVVLYDDLTNHAQIHREIALMTGANPGRDSYPGDTFFRHSSLLERAGKLASNGKTLTAIPAVLTPGNDITAYLPTNVISITDGQIIFDANIFKEGRRPAINIGLSVSRVGGRAQSDYQKSISSSITQYLNSYRSALEFSHFASEMAPEARDNLHMGERIFAVLSQKKAQLYSLAAQQVMLDAILNASKTANINIDALKQYATDSAPALDSPHQKPDVYKIALKQAIHASTVGGKK